LGNRRKIYEHLFCCDGRERIIFVSAVVNDPVHVQVEVVFKVCEGGGWGCGKDQRWALGEIHQ